MDTTRPATLNPDLDEEASRRPVKDLTFLLGPPAAPEDDNQIAEAAAREGDTPEDLWIEMVRGSVRELIEPDAEGRSVLDDIVSAAVGQQVTVWGVSGAEHHQAGHRLPGIIIDTAKVLDALGRTVAADFAGEKVRGGIARALMQYTHADWASCTAWYPSEELGFPNLDSRHGKEA